MHSYGGTAEMANSFLKMPKIGQRIYFSFSHCINMSSPKTLDVIKSIPKDRLMIESDQNTPLYIDDDMIRICEIVAKCKDWTVEETAKITYENTVRFFESIKLF